MKGQLKSTSIAQTQGFAPPEQHHCFSLQWTENKLSANLLSGWDEAACAPCASGADPARSCCHGKAISLGCVHRSPPHSSPPSPQQLRACLQPREGPVQPSEAIVQGQQGGGHRRPGLWGKGFESMVDFCRVDRELTDEGAALPGALLSLQSPGTRTAGPLHKVAGPSAGQWRRGG